MFSLSAVQFLPTAEGVKELLIITLNYLARKTVKSSMAMAIYVNKCIYTTHTC